MTVGSKGSKLPRVAPRCLACTLVGRRCYSLKRLKENHIGDGGGGVGGWGNALCLDTVESNVFFSHTSGAQRMGQDF